MYWLNLDWIVVNWMPLAVTLLLGFLLGWLLTGSSPARRVRELEATLADLEARHRKAERDATELKRQAEPLNARIAALQQDADSARAQVAGLEEQLEGLNEEKRLWEEQNALRNMALEELDMDAAAAPAQAEAYVEDVAQMESEGGVTGVAAEDAAGDIAEDFANVARSFEVPAYDAREVALNEAYSRLAALQQEVEDQHHALSSRQIELETLKAELVATSAARRELETRLLRAREDVASELAMLASTMIKMKDDALTRADARIVALTTELESLRASSARASARPVDRALDTAD